MPSNMTFPFTRWKVKGPGYYKSKNSDGNFNEEPKQRSWPGLHIARPLGLFTSRPTSDRLVTGAIRELYTRLLCQKKPRPLKPAKQENPTQRPELSEKQPLCEERHSISSASAGNNTIEEDEYDFCCRGIPEMPDATFSDRRRFQRERERRLSFDYMFKDTDSEAGHLKDDEEREIVNQRYLAYITALRRSEPFSEKALVEFGVCSCIDDGEAPCLGRCRMGAEEVTSRRVPDRRMKVVKPSRPVATARAAEAVISKDEVRPSIIWLLGRS